MEYKRYDFQIKKLTKHTYDTRSIKFYTFRSLTLHAVALDGNIFVKQFSNSIDYKSGVNRAIKTNIRVNCKMKICLRKNSIRILNYFLLNSLILELIKSTAS